MPHGQRDWSNIGAEATVAGVSDLGELAARLSSPVTFNREGNVLMLDTFDQGIGHWDATGIAPYEIKTVAEWSRYGGYSLKFDVAADAAKYGLIDTYLPYPVKSKYGLELSIRLNAYIGIVYIWMIFYDGAQYQEFEIYAWPLTKKLTLDDRDAGFVTFADPWVIRTSGKNWHTAKLVVDIVNQYYQRFIFDDKEYDLTAYRPVAITSDVASHVFLRLQFYGSSGGAGVVYLDDVIITQNEP